MTTAFTPDQYPLFYRYVDAPLQIMVSSTIVTSPIRVSYPIRVESGDDIIQTIYCAQPSSQGGVALWPWEPSIASLSNAKSKRYLGAEATACFSIDHPNTVRPSSMSRMNVQTLNTFLVDNGILPTSSSGCYPAAIPFIQSFSSFLTLSHLSISGFGVQLPPLKLACDSLSHSSAFQLRGGALGFYDSSINISDSSISFNLALEGGAIYALGGELFIDNSAIHNNKASFRGGGISVSGGVPTFSRSRVANNSVLGSGLWHGGEDRGMKDVAGGGGIFCFGVQVNSLTIKWTSIESNVVNTGRAVPQDVGGGLAASFCNFDLTNSNLVRNSVAVSGLKGFVSRTDALSHGGGVYSSRSKGVIRGTLLESNTAGLGGGGICFQDHGDADIEECEISDNRGRWGPGGGMMILHPYGRIDIFNTIFLKNTANASHGGGMAIVSVQQVEMADFLTVQSSHFGGNVAKKGGGALFVEGLTGMSDLDDNVFINNSALHGNDVATEPRILRVLPAHSVVLRFNEEFTPETLYLEALDENLEVVESFSEAVGKVVFTAIRGPQQLNLTATNVSPRNLRFSSGRATFEGMKLQITPGYEGFAVVEVNLQTRRLTSPTLHLKVNPCPGGYYLPTPDATSCLQCSPGRFRPADDPGCRNCNASALLPPSCLRCPSGTYSPSPASTTCTVCPAGRTSSSSGATECFPCKEGSFSGYGWSSCLACPRHALCTDGKLTFRQGFWLNANSLNQSGIPLAQTLKEFRRGLTFPSGQQARRIECSFGAHSMFNESIFRPSTSETRFFVTSDILGITPSTQILPCLSTRACEVECENEVLGCAPGHEG